VDISKEGFFTRILREFLLSPALATIKARQSILTILKDLIRHEVACRMTSKITAHLPFTFLSVLVSRRDVIFLPQNKGQISYLKETGAKVTVLVIIFCRCKC
jgi:hypothetical protein